MAVLALTVAFMVAIIITYNSGIFGGGARNLSGSGQALEPATTSPESSPDSEASGAASGKTYVVQDGDSFYSIARKFNTSISEIQKLNPNVDPQNLTSGTRLTMP